VFISFISFLLPSEFIIRIAKQLGMKFLFMNNCKRDKQKY